MRTITFVEALVEAQREEMRRDPSIFIMGEDAGYSGGAFGATVGLSQEFGAERVRDTPISEAAIMGAAVGAAMAGMRPIVEMQYMEFLPYMDALVNLAAKIHLMSGGQVRVPLVLRGPLGAKGANGAQHTQNIEAWFVHTPGLVVVMPSTPVDAKGLLKSAIRDDNPVLFLEAEMMYGMKGEVPDGEHIVPLGVAEVKRPGADVTIVSFSKPMRAALEAADALAAMGVQAEVIDLRTIRPLDEKTIYDSVAKTSRCVVVDEAWPFASVGSHVAWLVSRTCFDDLDAPVELVAGEDVPMPYNHTLELAAQPSAAKIVEAVKRAAYL